ncbi:glycine N-acyltransferase [Clupea harengus]|uniref:Glycine N-acyltransferase-like protein n=1 Tax=Clupea harengus TaxID=7950 RepID=A0A6P8F2P4_CLUHA|nr:glycine N-acyltransferase [Clupea harengus]XP_031418295.1 glycine N-acyltransferase [Clupea harengus]
MRVLSPGEKMEAEEALKLHFPESLKVYGCLFNINRGKPHNLEVIVDSWPDFKAIVCKPKSKGMHDREGDFNIQSTYSRDQDSLKRLIGSPGVLDWSAYTLLAGVDLNYLSAVTDLAEQHRVPSRTQATMCVLMLENPAQLRAHESAPGCQIQPLRPEHAELVNSTWRYGGDPNSYNSVLGYITHHPNLSVIPEDGPTGGGPVAWVLLYHHCALGLLYTLPQYRRRGYARTLVSRVSEMLLEKGYPVYCFVDETNHASCRLFRSLGFIDKESYRAVWFEINERPVRS